MKYTKMHNRLYVDIITPKNRYILYKKGRERQVTTSPLGSRDDTS